MNFSCLSVLYQELGQKGALVCHDVTWDCRVLQSHCSAPHSASTAWTTPRCGYREGASYRVGVKHQFFTFGQGFSHICLLYSWTLKLFWLIPYPTPDMVQIIWAKTLPYKGSSFRALTMILNILNLIKSMLQKLGVHTLRLSAKKNDPGSRNTEITS